MTRNQVELFGIPFCSLTFEEVCACVAERVRQREPGFIVTPNVDHVCLFQRDLYFREAYLDAFLVLTDGMPIVWASRLLRRPLAQKLSGSDLVPQLSAFAAREGLSIFLLGAMEGVGEVAAETLQRRCPGLRIAGAYSPPLSFEGDPRTNEETIRRLNEAKPDICFVALGSPRQEIWMHRNYKAAGVPIMLGIGAGLDFMAGRVKRAPVWMQNAGMEWMWRLGLEPRRLWRRYLVEDLLFFRLFWMEVLKRAWQPGRE